MTYVPTEYSIILEILFFQNNCTVLVEKQIMNNDCNTYDMPSITDCCLQIMDVSFGRHNWDTCYPYQKYNSSYTNIEFHCVNPDNTKSQFIAFLGLVFVVLGLSIFVGAVLKNHRDKHRVNRNLIVQERNKQLYQQISLNSGYLIDDNNKGKDKGKEDKGKEDKEDKGKKDKEKLMNTVEGSGYNTFTECEQS